MGKREREWGERRRHSDIERDTDGRPVVIAADVSVLCFNCTFVCPDECYLT